jgi:hypothetical protein
MNEKLAAVRAAVIKAVPESGALETNGRGDGILGLSRHAAVRRFVCKARGYWAFVRWQVREECSSRTAWRRKRNRDPTFSEFVGRQLARGSDTDIQLPD